MAKNIFLEAKQHLVQNDRLNYMNYEDIREEKKEFIRNDFFDFEFISTPSAVYCPKPEILKARLAAIEPNFPAGVGLMEVTIRGFTIRQAVIQGTTAGSIALTFYDREDQAISAFIDDWRDKLGDRQNRYAFRKEDTCAEGKLTVFNTSRKPIREYTMHSLQIADGLGTLNVAYGSDDPQQSGTCQLVMNFEHYDYQFLNY